MIAQDLAQLALEIARIANERDHARARVAELELALKELDEIKQQLAEHKPKRRKKHS